jgi:WD40 repeat protein
MIVALGACSTGDASSKDTIGSSPQLGEPVRFASAEPLAVDGQGRTLAARFTDDGGLFVVTTTGVHVAAPASDEVEPVVSFEPGGRPTLVAISPVGDEVAVLGGDLQSIRVYATADGAVTRAWPVPLGAVVRDIWFEPSTGRLVVETGVGPVLLDVDGGVSFDASSSPMPTGRLAALPDGTVVGAIVDSSDLLVVGEGGDVERHPIELGEGERLEDVRVAPDGGRIAVSASSGEDELERQHRVILLDPALAALGSIDTGRRLDAPNWALTNDSVIAAVDTELMAWSADGTELGRAETRSPVVSLHALDGDEVVVIGQDGSIGRWDGVSAPVSVADPGVTTVYESVDAHTGVITTVDLFGLVDVRGAGGQVLRSEDAFAVGELTSLAVSADGSAIAAGSTVGTVRVLDADLITRQDVPAAPYGVRVDAVAFDPRSGNLVTGLSERLSTEAFDDSVTGWSNEFTERFRALGDVADVPGCAFFNARLRFDPSGTLLAAATHDFGVAVIDPATGEELDELPGAAAVVDLAFSPDGSVLVATHDDGVVDVWDAADRSLLATYRPEQPGVGAIAILPEADVMVVADLTGAISLLDVMTGETFLVLDGAITRTRSLALTPDGAVVAAPMPDGTIGLWSTDSGAQIGAVPGHTGAVTALVFGPDGTRLYSASDDGTVRSWSIVIDT